jgi:hypothetical protein
MKSRLERRGAFTAAAMLLAIVIALTWHLLR